MSGVSLPLDTNIVIGLLKGYEPAVQLVASTGLPLNQAAVSQITRLELLGYTGITAVEEVAIQLFLQSVTCIHIDQDVETAAIGLRRKQRIKLQDAIIAGTALAKNLKLITLDRALLDTLQLAQTKLSA